MIAYIFSWIQNRRKIKESGFVMSGLLYCIWPDLIPVIFNFWFYNNFTALFEKKKIQTFVIYFAQSEIKLFGEMLKIITYYTSRFNNREYSKEFCRNWLRVYIYN